MLPVWIHDTVGKDEQEVRFEAQGSWLEVATQAAQTMGYDLTLLDDFVIWIGPPEHRAAAGDFVRRSRARIAKQSVAEEILAEKLYEPAGIFLVGANLLDGYVADIDGCVVITPGDEAYEKPVDIRTANLPLHLALSLCTEKLTLNWETAEGCIAIGPRNWTSNFCRTAQNYRLEHHRLLQRTDKLAEALTQVTTLEFIETPLTDVADYLSDLHDVPIVVDDVLAETPMTIRLQGSELAWALTALTFKYDLAWHSDIDAIHIGKAARLTAFRKLSADLAERCATYPKSLAADLTKPLKWTRYDTEYLADAAKRLSSATGLRIEIDSDVEQAARVSPRDHFHPERGLPLDLQLSLMTEAIGLRWLIRGDQVIIAPQTPMQNEE